MGRNLRWAAGCEIGDQRRAYVRASSAAVLEEEKCDLNGEAIAHHEDPT